MRIVGGKYKGRRLPVSSKLDLRPTTDFAKEALFNLLRSRKDITDTRFLELFSGTGSISFELLSRGAASGVCVDITAASHKYRAQIMSVLEIDSLQSIKSDVFRYLSRAAGQYDLIFADPPYDLERLPELPRLILDQGLLLPDGLLILEHPEEHSFGQDPNFVEHRKYGRVNFSFFNSEA